MTDSNSNPDTCGQQGRPKKRARVISTLTEEQLQHKRNVDRKAQRAFRQRTKDSIERLEQQIAAIQKTAAESEARFQHDLGMVRESNQTLVQCLEHISKLASDTVHSIALGSSDGGVESRPSPPCFEPDHRNPTLTSTPRHDLALDAPHIITPVASERETTHPHFSTAAASREPEGSPEILPVATPPLLPQQSSTQSDHPLAPRQRQQQQSHTHNDLHHPLSELYDHGQASQHLSPTSLTSTGAVYPSPSTSHQFVTVDTDMETSNQSHPGFIHDANDAICDNTVLSPQVSDTSPTNSTTYAVGSKIRTRPVFAVLPSHVPPTCPLDEILHNFMISQRELIAQGLDVCNVVGPSKPTVKALLDTSKTSSVPPLCGIMSEVLTTFAHVNQPEKLAFFYLMYKTMRWQISPSKDGYTSMPMWLRPTVTQITVPHAAWIDNIPWPGVRDILIENPSDHPFDLFSQYYSHNVSVNWQFDLLDAVTDFDSEVMLHSIFEKHICNLKNWTVAAEFQSRFPYMSSAIFSRD